MNHSSEDKEQKSGDARTHSYSSVHHIPGKPGRPVIGGIIIIVIGVALLIQQIPGVDEMLPSWLFTWPMILIILGLFAGIKNKSFLSGAIPFLVGLFFLLNNEQVINASLQPFLIPILIILFGLFLVLHRHKRNKFMECRRQFRRNHPHRPPVNRRGRPPFPFPNPGMEGSGFHHGFSESAGTNSDSTESDEDYMDVNSVFGSAEKRYFSKNFKGGNITCVFGGGKINLSQADIQDSAVLNVSINFGGAEIIVPSNWQVQNEMNALFGGIEDKRQVCRNTDDATKILILRGNVFCGGIELRS